MSGDAGGDILASTVSGDVRLCIKGMAGGMGMGGPVGRGDDRPCICPTARVAGLRMVVPYVY